VTGISLRDFVVITAIDTIADMEIIQIEMHSRNRRYNFKATSRGVSDTTEQADQTLVLLISISAPTMGAE
jgi:hypothetical protein